MQTEQGCCTYTEGPLKDTLLRKTEKKAQQLVGFEPSTSRELCSTAERFGLGISIPMSFLLFSQLRSLIKRLLHHQDGLIHHWSQQYKQEIAFKALLCHVLRCVVYSSSIMYPCNVGATERPWDRYYKLFIV